MKYSTLQKAMMSTMALVATLALGAQAGQQTTSSTQQDRHGAVATPSGSLVLLSAASRKNHGPAGAFDIDLPLTSPVGIEPRGGHAYTVVFTFNNAIASIDDSRVVQNGGACEPMAVYAVINGNEVIEGWNFPCDPKHSHCLVLTRHVVDTSGNSIDSVAVNVGVLPGDVTGDDIVSPDDLRSVKSVAGEPTNSSNFRNDVNLDGRITKKDLQFVGAHLGNRLP